MRFPFIYLIRKFKTSKKMTFGCHRIFYTYLLNMFIPTKDLKHNENTNFA